MLTGDSCLALQERSLKVPSGHHVEVRVKPATVCVIKSKLYLRPGLTVCSLVVRYDKIVARPHLLIDEIILKHFKQFLLFLISVSQDAGNGNCLSTQP